MSKDIYSFGECEKCGVKAPLKDGQCVECNKNSTDELPDIFRDIFNPFKEIEL